MKTNKFFIKYIMLGLLIGVGFTSCNDDDLGEAPRLFRPIPTLENNGNKLTATWDNILGATSYELILYKANGQDEDENDIFEEYEKVTVSSSPYVFENLEWDEKYMLKIKALGTNIQSEYYESDDVSIVYPTSITEIRTIDVAILLLWTTNGNPITSLKIIANDGSETIDVEVSEEEFESGRIEVTGLTPETSYTIYAYSGEEQSMDTYEGRLRFTTAAPEDFEALYGAGKYLDLRSVSDSAEVLQSAEIKAQMEAIDGLAIILRGGFEYKVNNSVSFKNSVTFITGLTLEGNAVFVQSGGMQAQSGATVDKVRFEKINFISDVAYGTEDYLRENQDAGFGGRQVYNVNGSNSVINTMEFVNCRIEGYRAIVRFQQAGEGIKNILFDDCTINGIGNQAAVTTTNLAGIVQNVTFNNSTLFNIVMLCDLRASESQVSFNITDCTFCYAPIETTANANTPLLRVGSNDVVINISNSIFGPSLATVGSAGSLVETYTAGTAGSVMLADQTATVAVSNSYKTNFAWADINDKTYPILGLAEAGLSEENLFADPQNEDFTITTSAFAGSRDSGAIKWRMP